MRSRTKISIFSIILLLLVSILSITIYCSMDKSDVELAGFKNITEFYPSNRHTYSEDYKTAVSQAPEVLGSNVKEIYTEFTSFLYDCICTIQESRGRSPYSTDYKGIVTRGVFHKNDEVKLISQNREVASTHIHWIQKRDSSFEQYSVAEIAETNDTIIISLPHSAPDLNIGDQIVITNISQNIDNSCKQTVPVDIPKEELFKMEIQSVYKLSSGVIVSGLIDVGKIDRGDKVTIKRTTGTDLSVEVNGISSSSKLLASASVGTTVELFLAGIKISDVNKGDIVYR